jgi:hypothetical protein
MVRGIVKKTVSNDKNVYLQLQAGTVNMLLVQEYLPTSEYENEEVK